MTGVGTCSNITFQHFSSFTLRAQNNRIGEASRDDELKIKVIFKEIIDFMYFCRDFKYKRKRITLLLLPLDTHKNKTATSK